MATAAKRYEDLAAHRTNVLYNAREASRLTLPGLIPPAGEMDPHGISEQPYSSLGARGVNNVSAKLLVSLFPPERPFFRQDISTAVADNLGEKLGEAQAKLADISYQAMILADSSGSRTTWMEVFRHLVVAGNMLVYHPDDGSKMRVWRLDQFVVRRDAEGKLLEAIAEEHIYPSELTDDERKAVGLSEEVSADGEDKREEKVKLYTWIKRDGKTLHHFQEVNGHEVPGSKGSAPADKAGWQALRWQEVPGSDYGRGYVTEYAGDFYAMNDGMKSILELAAEAARILHIVDPNSGIDVEELAGAETGDFLTGYKDKIQTLQLEKNADFNILFKAIEMIERRLSQAFLLTANTIRDAERVTAEEIRAVASELENAFGGTYTVLSSEVQRPYANRLLYILTKQGKAPSLPDSVSVTITTGFAALGQNNENAALLDWLTGLENIFGPEWLSQNVDAHQVSLRLGSGVSNVMQLLKDPAQVQQEQQAAQLNAAATRAAPQLVKSATDMAAQDQPQG